MGEKSIYNTASDGVTLQKFGTKLVIDRIDFYENKHYTYRI